jgi:site-specific DNA-methyltransferase (adenine-specific)
MSRAATPADVLSGAARWCVVEGDALDVVRTLPLACLDAVVTDPPSGIAFMGAEWDRDKGGRAQWVAWLAEVLGLARAATRDGGRALVWSLPRTSHWTGCAVEDAGWSIESTVTHLFGTGWPKGQSQLKPAAETWWLARTGRSEALNIEACRVGVSKRVPGSLSVSQLNGYGVANRRGQSLDDSGHRADVGRYPPNVVLSHAPGCRCVGERRVQTSTGHKANGGAYARGDSAVPFTLKHDGTACYVDPDGTELVEAWECVDGCPVRELDAQSGELTSGAWNGKRHVNKGNGVTLNPFGAIRDEAPRDGDTGTASRFFPQFPADPAVFGYHAKPSRAERDAGVSLDAQSVTRYSGMGQGPSPQQTPLAASAQGNNHPTVKSIALMRWLVRLVSQRGQVILDTFAGSGTTGVAALAEGRRVILIEREPRFAEIARQRCESVTMDLGVPVRVAPKAAPVAADPRQLSLLGGGE